ncbi:unnamed protein product [Vitrella brassicaformis CCMP3155]|uniref:Uncharacterized protein n=2 Tax=Vitrella brassicaformis TaxID=1169539 RepID=A0A0G4EUH0_VITBC|nr:unnamed protein product [Vitrella brassicaformis CCMP3155]|eukprot:CEM02073.1 unnamed protein product [Vitrella brassicaformis CCMP3155]
MGIAADADAQSSSQDQALCNPLRITPVHVPFWGYNMGGALDGPFLTPPWLVVSLPTLVVYLGGCLTAAALVARGAQETDERGAKVPWHCRTSTSLMAYVWVLFFVLSMIVLVGPVSFTFFLIYVHYLTELWLLWSFFPQREVQSPPGGHGTHGHVHAHAHAGRNKRSGNRVRFLCGLVACGVLGLLVTTFLFSLQGRTLAHYVLELTSDVVIWVGVWAWWSIERRRNLFLPSSVHSLPITWPLLTIPAALSAHIVALLFLSLNCSGWSPYGQMLALPLHTGVPLGVCWYLASLLPSRLPQSVQSDTNIPSFTPARSRRAAMFARLGNWRKSRQPTSERDDGDGPDDRGEHSPSNGKLGGDNNKERETGNTQNDLEADAPPNSTSPPPPPDGPAARRGRPPRATSRHPTQPPPPPPSAISAPTSPLSHRYQNEGDDSPDVQGLGEVLDQNFPFEDSGGVGQPSSVGGVVTPSSASNYSTPTLGEGPLGRPASPLLESQGATIGKEERERRSPRDRPRHVGGAGGGTSVAVGVGGQPTATPSTSTSSPSEGRQPMPDVASESPPGRRSEVTFDAEREVFDMAVDQWVQEVDITPNQLWRELQEATQPPHIVSAVRAQQHQQSHSQGPIDMPPPAAQHTDAATRMASPRGPKMIEYDAYNYRMRSQYTMEYTPVRPRAREKSPPMLRGPMRGSAPRPQQGDGDPGLPPSPSGLTGSTTPTFVHQQRGESELRMIVEERGADESPTLPNWDYADFQAMEHGGGGGGGGGGGQ